MNVHSRTVAWTARAAMAAWGAIIGITSLMAKASGARTLCGSRGADAVIHLAAYALLGVLAAWASPALTRGTRRVDALLAAAFFGLIIEGAQPFINGPTALSLPDITANVIGAVLGAFLGVAAQRRAR